MKLGLINSAWALAGRETAWGIEQTKKLGFDTIDIFADPLDIDVRERQLVRRECDRVGLPIVSLCCVATGLIDFNPSVQRFHVDRVAQYLDLAYEFSAKNVLLVLGEYIWNREVIRPDAADLGLKIALELEPFPLSLLNNVDSMVRFIEDVDHEAVRANIDVSHLVLANVPAEEIRKLSGKAIHVHISDCDGKVHGDLPPGRGVVKFDPYLQEIAKLGIDGSVSIELEYSPEPDQIEAWVAEAFRETQKLMQKNGLLG